MAQRKPHTTGCRVCGESTRGGARGLCQKHYRRWKAKYDQLMGANPAAAEQFELDCQQKGWIKPRSAGGRPKEDSDPFDSIAANAVLKVSGASDDQISEASSLEAESAQLNAQGAAEIEEKLAIHQAKKATKSPPKRKASGQ
ncbi:hypothetical protein [Crateriforma conspicua]|uniref:Uncharacterized protein n=1 Tax=Crateriforma conspicua TaxID=2527996 RepID=A0A5C6FVN4_9PLAN|nr:hypothetical protein [Crateriforma conspicua]TWU66481.1 hypothetical protein V7x_20470 [Crateriforma conspicua]